MYFYVIFSKKDDVLQIILCDQPDHDAFPCFQTTSILKKRASYLVRFVVYIAS